MTDIVVISPGRAAGDDMYSTRQGFISSLGDWIVPVGEAPLAARYAARPEYDTLTLADVEDHAFEVTSTSGTSFAVDIAPGEAHIAASPLITDETRTVSGLPANALTTLYLGANTSAQDDIHIGPASDFGSDWYRTPIHDVETDGSGVMDTLDRRHIGEDNQDFRVPLNIASFDEDVDFNFHEAMAMALWQTSGVPSPIQDGVPYLNTDTYSGDPRLEMQLGGDRYEIVTQPVSRPIENWDDGSAGTAWTLDNNHTVVSPGLDGSAYRLALDGFGTSESTSELDNPPSPGEWFECIVRYRTFHSTADSFIRVRFGVNGDSYYTVWVERAAGGSTVIEIRKQVNGTNEPNVIGRQTIPDLQADTEYRAVVYWGATNEQWELEWWNHDTGTRLGTWTGQDDAIGAGDVAVENNSADTEWDFDELRVPPRN